MTIYGQQANGEGGEQPAMRLPEAWQRWLSA